MRGSRRGVGVGDTKTEESGLWGEKDVLKEVIEHTSGFASQAFGGILEFGNCAFLRWG
jgi:hypothetical protein